MKTFNYLALFVALVAICGLKCSATTAAADPKACESCKKIFNFISNVTHNGDTKLKQSVAKLCSEYSYLPGKQAYQWCYKAVDQFFNTMNTRLNPETVCYDIQACHDDRDNGIREIQGFDRKEDCDFCVYISSKVKELVTGGPTEIEIKTHLEDTCHYLQSFENECLNLVDQYVDSLFKFIKESFQPNQLCKSLRICAVRTGPLRVTPLYISSASDIIGITPVNMGIPNKNDTSVQPVNNGMDDINCDICKKIVKIIQQQLKDNATDEQIVNVLTEVCDILPSNERSSCKSVVTDYANRLIQVLTQDIDSNLACTLVGLCVPQSFWNYINGHYVKKHNESFLNVSKNAACVECQLITHFIQNELYNYKNEEQIEEFVMNHFCKKIGLFVNESSCDTFIKEYGPIILQTIAQEIFDPSVFCFKEIHVCPSKSDISSLNSVNRVESLCQMCQGIVQSLHKFVDREVDMELLIDKACSHLPKPHQVECGLMMKTFAPYFFDIMQHIDNAQEICKSVDICMVPGNVHLLGGHKCTYGPTYWCHTSAHADACKASSYCRKKVWRAISN